MWDLEKHLFLTVIDNISKNNIIFVKWRKASTPPKSRALHFWKITFLHIPFFSRAEDFLSQGNTSLRISIKFHFSMWLNTIHLKKLHIIKRDVKTIYLWVLYRDNMNNFFNMTQTVRSFICGRFIIYFSLRSLYFLQRRKPSHHPFMGALSRLSL